MASADAGPFGTPTRAQRASSPSTSPTFSRSASVTLEPYDSPLKPEHAGSTYASGGQETDLAEEDEDGDLGVRPSRRDKGKGRAVDEEGQPGSMRSANGEVKIQMEEEADQVDEAAEERRVQENLARWSRADAKRRASLRRSTKLVYPSLPSPPPLPPASTLIRRTSTLLRTGSTRRRGTGSVDAEELELGGAGQAGGESSVSDRRGRRRLSVKIDSGRDSSPDEQSEASPAPQNTQGFARLAEEDEELAQTPTSERPSADSAQNPFSSSNASFATFDTAQSQKTIRTTRTGSRFVEDLPPLPQSPPSPSSSVDRDPFASPHASPSKPSHHIVDVIVTQPTPSRPTPFSRPSQQSIATFASTTAPSFASEATTMTYPQQLGRPDSPEAYSTGSSPLASPGFGSARRRRSGGREGNGRSDSDDSYGRQGLEKEEEIGWLDWLLCGCFRTGTGQRDEEVEQQGRTNPME
ncbi:Serine/arginine repetitive matrix 1 [Rhodotorula toruloides ATCC 204091]|uniref:Uncharacterized protein n=1 Tax=Rhodotorula toruloides TaxID=5286 RepID=A0A0K3CC51_RHOTO|nr:Serine/arginine repetitive matrix 1 [Rhodotorula toruloides ATCC 204091]KAK4336457.1 hypothetical protein RTBOTA2_005225 [Rhodotorula toruloides]PRQ74211.1 hypothetical protein AAT19DRAFT_14564 [Rhodotorula toruloides]